MTAREPDMTEQAHTEGLAHSGLTASVPPSVSELTVSEVLSRAADLLEKPGAWTQGYVARNRSGELVEADARSAVCWCGIGAVMRVARKASNDKAETEGCKALHALARAKAASIGFGPWNDAPGRTQAEVVAALREAGRLSAPPSPEQVGGGDA